MPSQHRRTLKTVNLVGVGSEVLAGLSCNRRVIVARYLSHFNLQIA
jgi:hypothetical protein